MRYCVSVVLGPDWRNLQLDMIAMGMWKEYRVKEEEEEKPANSDTCCVPIEEDGRVTGCRCS